jgi:hypothetical protein
VAIGFAASFLLILGGFGLWQNCQGHESVSTTTSSPDLASVQEMSVSSEEAHTYIANHLDEFEDTELASVVSTTVQTKNTSPAVGQHSTNEGSNVSAEELKDYIKENMLDEVNDSDLM